MPLLQVTARRFCRLWILYFHLIWPYLTYESRKAPSFDGQFHLARHIYYCMEIQGEINSCSKPAGSRNLAYQISGSKKGMRGRCLGLGKTHKVFQVKLNDCVRRSGTWPRATGKRSLITTRNGRLNTPTNIDPYMIYPPAPPARVCLSQ